MPSYACARTRGNNRCCLVRCWQARRSEALSTMFVVPLRGLSIHRRRWTAAPGASPLTWTCWAARRQRSPATMTASCSVTSKRPPKTDRDRRRLRHRRLPRQRHLNISHLHRWRCDRSVDRRQTVRQQALTDQTLSRLPRRRPWVASTLWNSFDATRRNGRR